jgi:hypothetical protein
MIAGLTRRFLLPWPRGEHDLGQIDIYLGETCKSPHRETTPESHSEQALQRTPTATSIV